MQLPVPPESVQFILPMPMQNGTRLGPYEIIEAIGAGGMGEVYRAKDPRIGRDVAIKVLRSGVHIDAGRMRRFEQEARAAGALNHPGLLAIYDIGREGESPWIVTELLEGETLRERLGVPASGTHSTDSGKLSMRRVADWGVQIANALGAAHEAGIVHRDLKPENIFITRDGRVKILDFGLAKLQGPLKIGSEEETIKKETEPGTVMGTVGYMSPEQVQGQDVDHRSDIFSFGVILYEMISGRRAFHRASRPETMTAILREDPPDLSTINPAAPPSLVRIAEHCLEKRPEQRFQSARDLSFHLQQMSDDSGRGSAIQGPAPRRPVIRWWPAAVAVVGALLIGVLGGRVWTTEKSTGEETSSSAGVAVQAITFSGKDVEPSVSPDGKMIAFASARDGKARIWIKQTIGGSELALTAGIDSVPRFSPDGSSILFARDEGLGRRSIYKVPILGGEPRKLVDDAYAADWSPDGLSLVCLRSSPRGELTRTIILTASADGSNQKEIATIDGKGLGCPRWSPDGRRIALADFSFGNYAHQPLVMAGDGSDQQWLALPVDADIQPAVAWAGADRLVIGTLPSATNLVSGTGSLILLHDLMAGSTRNLFHVATPVAGLDLLADGRLVLGSSPLRQNYNSYHAEKKGIWKVRPDGSEATRIAKVDSQLPGVSPDGRYVSFCGVGGGELKVVGLSDGKLYSLGPTGDSVYGYIAISACRSRWTPDGKAVVFVDLNDNGQFGLWTQPFVAGNDTRSERRPLPGFDSDLDVESFAFSPDGSKVTISIVDQLSSLMMSDPVPELVRAATRP